MTISTWILAVITSAVPLDYGVKSTMWWGPDAWEIPGKAPVGDDIIRASRDARQARYADIAKAMEKVFFDPSEEPLMIDTSQTDPEKGKLNGRFMSAALAVGVMAPESYFHRNVQLGLSKGKGDNGKSWCLGQINIGDGRIALNGDSFKYVTDGKSGWSGKDLVDDLDKCLRIKLHIMRDSFKKCKKNPLLQKLNAYTSGDCEKGGEASEYRMKLGFKTYKDNPVPAELLK